MYVGSGNLCLKVEDLDRSIRFYQALGLQVVPGAGVPGQSALVHRGSFSIFLMNFGADLGASDECLHAFRAVLARFGSTD